MSQITPILIINWNGNEDTYGCIDSLCSMDNLNFKIILADNGSTKENQLDLRSKYENNDKIDLLLFDKNHGFTKGTNKMLSYVFTNYENRFEHIIMLNNDTVVASDWLSKMLIAAKENDADIVACKMINFFNHNELDNLGHRMLNTGEIIPIAHREDPKKHTGISENFGSCAGASLYNAQMLKKIGFFDPYFETGYEDAELGVRAVVLGYKSISANDAIVYHKISQSVKKVFDFDYVLKIQKSIFYSYLKLMPWPVVLINLPWFIFKYILVLLVDIFAWRPKYLKMLLRTFKEICIDDRKLIGEARRQFIKNHKPISSFAIMKKQEFFLWFDIKRFVKYILLRKQSEFDKIKEGTKKD